MIKKNSRSQIAPQITYFLYSQNFRQIFLKTIHKQVIKCRKLVPLKHLHVYNNIIKYETEHKERVHALRMTFHPNYIKAFIIPSTDPHLSEYVIPTGCHVDGFQVLQVLQEQQLS